MFPLFTTRCLHVRHDVRDPSGGSGNCGRECCPVILPKWRLPRHLGIFYMPQIYDMGPTALLPLRRKACWGFFSPLKIRRFRPGSNPRTWVPKASTLPLDHRSQSLDRYKFEIWHRSHVCNFCPLSFLKRKVSRLVRSPCFVCVRACVPHFGSFTSWLSRNLVCHHSIEGHSNALYFNFVQLIITTW